MAWQGGLKRFVGLGAEDKSHPREGFDINGKIKYEIKSLETRPKTKDGEQSQKTFPVNWRLGYFYYAFQKGNFTVSLAK